MTDNNFHKKNLFFNLQIQCFILELLKRLLYLIGDLWATRRFYKIASDTCKHRPHDILEIFKNVVLKSSDTLFELKTACPSDISVPVTT